MSLISLSSCKGKLAELEHEITTFYNEVNRLAVGYLIINFSVHSKPYKHVKMHKST